MGSSSAFSALLSAAEVEKDPDCAPIRSQLCSLFRDSSACDWAGCYECKTELWESVKPPSVLLFSHLIPRSHLSLPKQEGFSRILHVLLFYLSIPTVLICSLHDYSELSEYFLWWCKIKVLQVAMHRHALLNATNPSAWADVANVVFVSGFFHPARILEEASGLRQS